MKVTVVGFWHAYPEKNEATSGYLVEHGETKVLLDCGSGVLSNLGNYCDVTELDGLVLSHYHHDHFADVGPLQYARIINESMGKNTKPLTIYGHQEDSESFSKLTYKGFVQSSAYKEDHPLKIGPFTFTFQRTKHPVPCFAMKVTCEKKTLVYTGDSSYFEQLAEFTKGSDLLIAECSGYRGDQVARFGHMNSEDVAKLANSSAVDQVMISHLPHHGEHEQLKEEIKQSYEGEVLLARTGLTIEL
ncbi:MBL fold metallo-hydrolase [Bacillus sp. FJAT-45037]|uniref:MBL fold metallo-hydrolase n=1 Tax=Bacillus sp. FJAT-45037 TaxID=2011007 RepID=UPI000C2475C0|nr:MBL fold metallo-hydrolase [Bacillus sp. FJAT-45037]